MKEGVFIFPMSSLFNEMNDILLVEIVSDEFPINKSIIIINENECKQIRLEKTDLHC